MRNQIGMIAHDMGDYAKAGFFYQQSLSIFEELGTRQEIAAVYHQMGRLTQESGEYAEARRWYKRSFDIFEELGDRAALFGR